MKCAGSCGRASRVVSNGTEKPVRYVCSPACEQTANNPALLADATAALQGRQELNDMKSKGMPIQISKASSTKKKN